MIVRGAETVAERARGREEAAKEAALLLSLHPREDREEEDREKSTVPLRCSIPLAPEVKTKTSTVRYVTLSPPFIPFPVFIRTVDQQQSGAGF
ncbi:hypothetical protein VZT92_016358 [Zoarces viviparus]|uniref:Uncharacterized protein n=1 Tax=Zoarces viviparus TaxID=48416 RepID=A0AAW1ETG1_ZOAVI